MTTRLIGLALTGPLVVTLATALPAAAHAQAVASAQASSPRAVTRIAPYIEASQVLTADLNSGDVLTYTQVSAGIDATMSTRRVSASIAARYDHNFAYQKDVTDDDVVTGLAKASVVVARGLTVDGGIVASRARSDIRGAAPVLTQGNLANTSTVVSGDFGPSLATHAGPIGIAASYRYGQTRVSRPTASGLPNGARPQAAYDDSQRQLAVASAGLKPGQLLPVGLSISGAYERETADQLDQKYEGYYGRGDVVVPVSPVLALTAGAGYENIEIGQRDPLLTAQGVPVVDSRGRYVTNPASPRRIAFDTTGLFWDAGVLYRPSPRTTLQARVGRRYDTISYTGSLAYQASQSVGLNIGVYDGIQSFGRQLRAGVASIPNTFTNTADPLSQNYNGCVFGQSSAEAGGCLNSAFQSITTANYRARGVDAVLVARQGPTTLGFGAGYANRRFLLPNGGPNLVQVNGQADQSFYAQAFAARQLDANSGIDANLSANVYDSGIANADTVYSFGASGSYYRRFGRLGATASLGIFGFDSAAIQQQVDAQARVGLRYGF